jgi:hypothetical protein
MDAFGGCAIIVVIPLPRPAAKGGTRTKSENTEPDIYT